MFRQGRTSRCWAQAWLGTGMFNVGAAWVVLTGASFSATPIQTSVSCLSGGGVTMSGCTAFGWGSDNNVKSYAVMFLGAEGHESTEFCNRVWEDADSWLSGYLNGVFESATLGGISKDAIGVSTGSGWVDGWLGIWIRDSGSAELARGYQLKDVALHEAGHKVCDSGDFGGNCGSGEEGIDQAVSNCSGQN